MHMREKLARAHIGSTVFVFANMHYMASETQGLCDYNVKFDDGFQAKDLGVVVNVNLSFARTWFVGEEKNVTLEVSAYLCIDTAQ